jgi:hypothetical protein
MSKKAKLPPSNFYTRSIMTAAKVKEREAHLIERVMRDGNGGVLDNLRAPEFNALAREGKKALDEDTELRRLVEEEVLG